MTDERTPGGTWRRLVPWIPAIVWTCLIFGVSSIPTVQHPFLFELRDKVMHVIEYGILGTLLTVGFRNLLLGKRASRIFFSVLALGVVIGLLDEVYQISVPGREGDVLDWVADGVGVALGFVVGTVSCRLRGIMRRVA